MSKKTFMHNNFISALKFTIERPKHERADKAIYILEDGWERLQARGYGDAKESTPKPLGKEYLKLND